MEADSEKRPYVTGPQMDPETALELVKKGATLLLLDVPQFTLVGIDTQMFSVGPIFKGIKMIPPGPHFIYYCPSNRDGSEFSPIIGFFITTCPAEVVIRKWDKQEEKLIKLSEEEEDRFCEAVRQLEFDHQLGPYALDHFGEWKQISNYITKSTIERIEPIGGEISIAYESELVDTVPRTAMEKELMQQLKKSKFSGSAEESQKRGCYYTPIPHVVKHKGIPGEELTALNLDKTQLLETILTKDFGGEEDLLLGELQFTFIAFLMGQSLEAFYQWKALVTLLFSCTEAPLNTRSQLFSKFVRVIYYQLKHGFHKDYRSKNGADRGVSLFLDDSWLSKEIFLYRLCKEFFSLVQEAPVVDGDLLSWVKKLKRLLGTKLGWDFQDSIVDVICEEEDEFSPVIVLPSDTSPGEGKAV